MITLHHLEKSQSIRILWLLEELGAPYEIKLYDRDPKTMLAPAEYKAVSPLGTAPVITEDQVTLAETNAIMDYILDRYDDGRLRPAPGSAERVRYLFWFHAAQGSLQPLLTSKFVLGAMNTRAPFLIRPIARTLTGAVNKAFFGPRLEAFLREAERTLSLSTWFAGEQLTAADIVIAYSLELATHRAGLDRETYPNIFRFVEQVNAYPSYQRAMEKDGKGTILL